MNDRSPSVVFDGNIIKIDLDDFCVGSSDCPQTVDTAGVILRVIWRGQLPAGHLGTESQPFITVEGDIIPLEFEALAGTTSIRDEPDSDGVAGGFGKIIFGGSTVGAISKRWGIG